MVDFAQLQETAQRLIEENGRSIVLLSDPSGVANPSEPERGPDFSAGATEVSLIGCFVPSGGSGLGKVVQELGGQLLQGFDDVVLIAALSLSDVSAVPISSFDRVRDGSGNVLRIGRVDVLKPGSLELLYQLGLER